MGASKLIAQMDWWNGLTEWIDFNTFDQPIVSKSIHIEERSLYAFVILHCRHLALQSRTSNWFQTIGEQLDWGMLSVSAASVPTLGEIPDWLIEPVIMGCLQEVYIPRENTNQQLWMQSFPVTQALFEAITEEIIWLGLITLDSISWYDAIRFCNRSPKRWDTTLSIQSKIPTSQYQQQRMAIACQRPQNGWKRLDTMVILYGLLPETMNSGWSACTMPTPLITSVGTNPPLLVYTI